MPDPSILIVEDEAIVAEDLARKLRSLGYTVAGTTALGEEALTLARDLRPRLVLMDIRLAGAMDGVEAAQRIRQECDVPVIYLTASSDRATIERAKITEPFGFILKPFENRDLVTHIEMAFYKHQAERKLREAHVRAEWLARFPQENPNPVLRVTLDGGVLYANPAAKGIPAWTSDGGTSIAQPLRVLVEQAVAKRAPIERDVELGGRSYSVMVALFPEERYANIYGRDITELKMMQKREKEDAIRLAWGQSAINTINAMHEGVALLEMDGTITSVNPAIERLTGLAGGALVGRNLKALLPELLAGADIGTAMRGLAVLRGGGIPALPPLLVMRPDGKAVHILPSVALMDEPEGRRVAVLTLKDVTELHENSQRLRELAERLVVTEEGERWRISRYIHDTILQSLSLSIIRLGAMEKPLTEASLNEEADRLRQVRALLVQACDECRAVMADLTPALLYELGLSPALNDLAEQLKAKHGTRMIVEDDGQETPMSHPLRGLLFESVRELVMNALKHAGPCEIRVTVSRSKDDLVICVTDNGKGFDTASAARQSDRKGGFGLFNIRQRVEGLGGRLEIESAPGKGTRATIKIPMSSEDRRQMTEGRGQMIEDR